MICYTQKLLFTINFIKKENYGKRNEQKNLRKIDSCNLNTLSLSGAGTGPNDCMSEEDYNRLCEQGLLQDIVYVCGWGWTVPEITVIGSGCGCGCGCGSKCGCGCGEDYGCGCGESSGSGCGESSGSGCGESSGSGCGEGSGSGCGEGSGSGLRLPLSCAADILHNARLYDGTPYKPAGKDKSGMDCSGLITVACGLSERWTTSGDLDKCGPFVRVYIPFSRKKREYFIGQLVVGDILVWRSEHVAIYAGGESIYHSSSKGVGETHDLMRHWLNRETGPEVYRFKK